MPLKMETKGKKCKCEKLVEVYRNILANVLYWHYYNTFDLDDALGKKRSKEKIIEMIGDDLNHKPLDESIKFEVEVKPVEKSNLMNIKIIEVCDGEKYVLLDFNAPDICKNWD